MATTHVVGSTGLISVGGSQEPPPSSGGAGQQFFGKRVGAQCTIPEHSLGGIFNPKQVPPSVALGCGDA